MSGADRRRNVCDKNIFVAVMSGDVGVVQAAKSADSAVFTASKANA